MKSIIIYYSYSGNTRKVAAALTEYFKDRASIEAVELRPQDESASFFSQCKRALCRKRAQLQGVNFDLSGYDLIFFGTPVWAFGPAPAMNAYLDKCFGLKNKGAIIFTTYGSGIGNQRCLNYMQELLAQKGVVEFRRFSVQQFKADNKEHVLAKIQEIMRL